MRHDGRGMVRSKRELRRMSTVSRTDRPTDRPIYIVGLKFACVQLTRPDIWLPRSRAGGQGPYYRLPVHMGRSSEAKDRKNIKKNQ